MDNADIEKKINTLEQKLEDLPNVISQKLSETMDLKIENATQKLKIDFYKWLVPIILTVLGTLAVTVFNLIK